ncbi:MAG: DNA polymerase III subunit gamma/tau, partial [Crenarchaeota archaeon]|nr:DNA polymerase III subunit gamma/tau [Thermoproteota archaeon]
MSVSLAVKYRPTEWESVAGQDSIVKILKRQLESGEIKNAYLFCGTSGCGKTSLARLFANKVNEGKGSPIEIDAASNSGVENVRQLIQSAQERSIDGKYKIFILDECHVFTTPAWNAFLKGIEEPPKYTIFIFCTTDPQKIPATILSRVQRYNFTRIANNTIKDRLEYICRNENITTYTDEAIDYISKISDGQLRLAISMMEKVIALGDLNIENTLKALGNYSYDVFFNLVNAVIDANEAEVLRIVANFYNEGNDLKLFVEQFLTFNLNVCKYALF